MPYSINSPPSTPRKEKKGSPLSIENSPTPKGQTVVAVMDINTPTSSVFSSIDLNSPSLSQLKLTKEIDSGVTAWETPSPTKTDSELARSIEIPPALQTIGQFRASLEIWQAMFPSNFCVFVGNLPNEHDDAALSQALRCMFSPYGACSTAVHRGREIVTANRPNTQINFSVDRRMPYGHVQFDNFESALNAVNQIHGPHTLGGRKLRTEFNKTNRNVLVFTAHPSIPPFDAVAAHLSQFGKIESVRATTMHDLTNALPVGVRVRFENHLGIQRMQRMVGNGDYYFRYCYKM